MTRQSPIPNGATILITGGTRFFGSHVVNSCLFAHPNDCNLRAFVRSEAKAEPLVDLKEAKSGKGRIQTVLVDNMVQPDAYDAALNPEIKGIVHVVEPTKQSLENLLS